MEYGKRQDYKPDMTIAAGSQNLYPTKQSPLLFPLTEKNKFLRLAEQAARSVDARIQNVTVSLVIQEHTIIIVPSFGQMVVDVRPLIRLSISCLAVDGNRRETGSSGGGGRYDVEYLTQNNLWQQLAVTAADEAISMLSAVPGPVGEMPVVLGNGWPGILLHEAVGHGLEGDFNRKGTSAFSKSMGDMVASPLVTVVDKGNIDGRRGSLNTDDEGTPTGDGTTLIEHGILVGYMQDRMNAYLMPGQKPTGNGRRESYKHEPMPRMTNTMMIGGDSSLEEMIASVKFGIYAKEFGGGQVDITNGNFTFSASKAYVIRDGKLAELVKGATLIGNGPDVMREVSMVGKDPKLDMGIGTCGKNGQSVPVGVGMPSLKVSKGITIGG
jgi:TldD protein